MRSGSPRLWSCLAVVVALAAAACPTESPPPTASTPAAAAPEPHASPQPAADPRPPAEATRASGGRDPGGPDPDWLRCQASSDCDYANGYCDVVAANKAHVGEYEAWAASRHAADGALYRCTERMAETRSTKAPVCVESICALAPR